MPSPQGKSEARAQTPATRGHSAVLLITSAVGCTTCRRTRCPLLDLLVINDAATDTSAYSLTRQICKPAADDRLPEVLRAQVGGLRHVLGKGWQVLGAVHGDSPSISDALHDAVQSQPDRLIVVPMHPQFSPGLGAAQLDELYSCLRKMGQDVQLEVRSSWHDDTAFIDATAHRLHAFATQNGCNPRNSVLVFQARAHQGDNNGRYRDQVAGTVELVRRRLGWPTQITGVVFGDVGTAACALDDLAEQVDALDPSASRRVIICPITDISRRTCEHSVCEAAYRAVLRARPLHLCPAFNDSEEFIKALAQLVRRPRHSAFELTHEPEPLFPTMDVSKDVTREAGTLVMIGVEVRGAMGAGMGPALQYSTQEDYRRLKRPHMETIDLLRHAAQCCDLRECWIWNTCTRFELYGWLPEGTTPEARRHTLERLASVMFPNADPRRINVLTGPAARLHMLRTAAGLNSHLVGDAEVVDQLDASRRAAEHAGSAGRLTNDFVDDAIEATRQLRCETAWSKFDNRYCATVLSRMTDRLAGPLSHNHNGSILVIGGSTTSCSILETLISKFGVRRERLSLIYRGRRKGALVRRLHNAVGEGQVTIVDSYTDEAVMAAVARADLVFFAIDQREAIATGEQLRNCRNLAARPLTILDFNTFGSVVHVTAGHGLDFVTAAEIDSGIDDFNADATSKPEFAKALTAAEAWIARHAGVSTAASGPRSAGPDLLPTPDFALPTSLLCETVS